jgi:uncharacterized membrane-anchored protein YjiN (DUF445 family)
MAKKAKHIAGVSLGVMGAGFLGSIPFTGQLWGSLLQGGFEAGLVGGLADWFAVTALFRHPMGIPIPHTALLPNHRERITKALVSSIENEWLNKESIEAKVKQVNITEQILRVLERELENEHLKQNMTGLLRHVLTNFDPASLLSAVERELKGYLQTLDLRTIVGQLINELLRKGYEEKAFDFIIHKLDEWATREETKTKLGNMALKGLDQIEVDGFLQFALKSFTNLINEEKLGSILQNLVRRATQHLLDPENQQRQDFLALLRKELDKLKANDALFTELSQWKESFLSEWGAKATIASFFERIREKGLRFVSQESFPNEYAGPALLRGLGWIRKQPLEQVENFFQRQIIQLVEKNHEKIGMLVEENLNKLDNETLTEMLEEKIGGDLQWIRVNGALCGFLIGLGLSLIRALVG